MSNANHQTLLSAMKREAREARDRWDAKATGFGRLAADCGAVAAAAGILAQPNLGAMFGAAPDAMGGAVLMAGSATAILAGTTSFASRGFSSAMEALSAYSAKRDVAVRVKIAGQVDALSPSDQREIMDILSGRVAEQKLTSRQLPADDAKAMARDKLSRFLSDDEKIAAYFGQRHSPLTAQDVKGACESLLSADRWNDAKVTLKLEDVTPLNGLLLKSLESAYAQRHAQGSRGHEKGLIEGAGLSAVDRLEHAHRAMEQHCASAATAPVSPGDAWGRMSAALLGLKVSHEDGHRAASSARNA